MSDIKYTYAHAAILVTDIERSKRFYERAVGWQHEFTMDFDGVLGVANGYGGPGKISMGKMGGVPLEFIEMKQPKPALKRKTIADHFGIFMCSVNVEKLGPVRERLKAADISITREVDVMGTRLLVVTDPDGQELGILGRVE